MKRGITVGFAVLVIVAVAVVAGPRLRQRAREVASNMKLAQDEGGDVMASATYQRFATRRKAVEQMRAALRTIALAESAFVADSGHPTSIFLPDTRYAFTIDPPTLVSIEIERDRWVAQARNNRTSMSCSLTAMLDTAGPSWRYHPGEPVCAEWTAESIAIAVAAPPPPSVPVAAVVKRSDEYEGPPRNSPPHRDWGPVNNTPPPTPWVVRNVCPGEYCSLGRWAACSAVPAYSEKRAAGTPVFVLRAHEEFTALSGDMHVDVPGIVVFRDTVVTPLNGELNESIRFTPQDTLYLLNEKYEGILDWWYRGRVSEGWEFWDPHYDDSLGSDPTENAVLMRRTESIWWVHVRNGAGRDGWIQYDFGKMSRNDRMDALSRCLHTARG